MTHRLMRWRSVRETKAWNTKIATVLRTLPCPFLLPSLSVSAHLFYFILTQQSRCHTIIPSPSHPSHRKNSTIILPFLRIKYDFCKRQSIHFPTPQESYSIYFKRALTENSNFHRREEGNETLSPDTSSHSPERHFKTFQQILKDKHSDLRLLFLQVRYCIRKTLTFSSLFFIFVSIYLKILY